MSVQPTGFLDDLKKIHVLASSGNLAEADRLFEETIRPYLSRLAETAINDEASGAALLWAQSLEDFLRNDQGTPWREVELAKEDFENAAA